MRRSTVLIGLAVIVAVAAIGGIGYAVTTGSRSGGPLAHLSRFEVNFALPPEETGTWGTVISNPVDLPITLESITGSNIRGITIVGMGMSDPEIDGGIGTAFGFPPAGVALAPVKGAVLPPSGIGHLQVLIGVRRDGSADGGIDALRVRYVYDGTTYEDVLPYSLYLRADAQSDTAEAAQDQGFGRTLPQTN